MTTSTQLAATDLGPSFGSEIHGLDPAVPLTEADRMFIRSVFDVRGVVVFRGLDIGRDHQMMLTLLVHGDPDLSDGHVAACAAQQSRFYISNRIEGAAAPFGRLLFHSDMMWSDEPFTVLSLYGEEVEAPVVPTTFVSTAGAWATLPPALHARVGDLSAVQVTGPEGFGDRRKGDQHGDLVQPRRDVVLGVTTPVGFRHPRTGQTLLFVSHQMTKEIAGVPPDLSDGLLDELFAHMYADANLLHHEWRPGDLVLWDNLAVQHARPQVSLDGPARTLRKTGWPIPAGAERLKIDSYEKLD